MAKISKAELKLTNLLIDSLDLDIVEYSNLNLLYFQGFPLKRGKQFLKMEEKFVFIDLNKYTFFRPFLNNKHMNLIIDLIYQLDDSIKELVIFEEDNTKHIKMIDEYNDIVVEESGETELEAKYRCIFSYFYNIDNYEEDLKIIKKEIK